MSADKPSRHRIPLAARGPDWIAWSLLGAGLPLLMIGLALDLGAFNAVGLVGTALGTGMIVSRVTWRRVKPDDA